MKVIHKGIAVVVVGTAGILLGAGLPACSSSSFALFDDAGAGDGAPPPWGNVDAGEEPQACRDGVCTCPPYKTYCDGKCIPTTADPANCGACGNTCTGALACSGGVCSGTCLPGLDKCGNACVARGSDSQNCGGCGNVCGPTQGCVAGKCENKIPVGPAPAKCAGGGPPIQHPPAQGGCLGNLAQTVFRWALCSCKDVQFSKDYVTDGCDSRQGPYQPGGLGAGIGANGNYGASGTGDVWGTLWIAGSGGIAPSQRHDIRSEVRSGGELKNGGGGLLVGGDAYVAGNVVDKPDIRGKLYLRNGSSADGIAESKIVRQNVEVKPPCDYCAEGQQVPIEAIVEAHRAPKNDNALIGLDAGAYESPTGPLRLDLPCGEYYLTRIASSHHVTIVAHGRTALYIDGEVSPNGLTIDVAPGAELDVFVRDKIQTSGALKIGSPNHPAATRVYVWGDSGMTISGEVDIAGNLYVPRGSVTYSKTAAQYGAIYAGNFSASEPVQFHYDRAILRAGDTCRPPTSGDDAGTPPPPTCGTCRDCTNQACNGGTCGKCGSSNDCCAPLVCREGTCVSDVH
ncbi:hypothetical protein LVJ94_07020 [Pendulispora rubella]|uniref:DUF7305 domain-containing protein n=1 Tax=Pendulispora rubella TaxID=2741070 RepID=A0ABZ2L7S6_9BACT